MPAPADDPPTSDAPTAGLARAAESLGRWSRGRAWPRGGGRLAVLQHISCMERMLFEEVR